RDSSVTGVQTCALPISADYTVHPDNAGEIVKQWLDLHHLPLAPMAAGRVNGYPHEQWWNADGETVVESFTITNMAHGTPIGVAEIGRASCREGGRARGG